MSYTPTEWETGDVVTASAMNKIENGIANSSGYDGVVEVVLHSDSSLGATYEAASGTYLSLVDIIENGTCPNILVKYYDEVYTRGWVSNMVKLVYYLEDDQNLVFAAAEVVSSNRTDFWYFYWNSDNELGYWD